MTHLGRYFVRRNALTNGLQVHMRYDDDDGNDDDDDDNALNW